MGLLQDIYPLHKSEHHPEGSVAKQGWSYSAVTDAQPDLGSLSCFYSHLKVRLWFILITTHSLIIINCCSVVHSSQNYFLTPLVSLEESPCHLCLGVMQTQKSSSHLSTDGPEGIMDQPKHYSKIKAITKRANKATGSSTSSGVPKGASSPDAQTTKEDDPN